MDNSWEGGSNEWLSTRLSRSWINHFPVHFGLLVWSNAKHVGD